MKKFLTNPFWLIAASITVFFAANLAAAFVGGTSYAVLSAITFVVMFYTTSQVVIHPLMRQRFSGYLIVLFLVFLYIALLTLSNMPIYTRLPGWRSVFALDLLALFSMPVMMGLLLLNYNEIQNIIKLLLALTALTFILLLPSVDTSVMQMSDLRITNLMGEEMNLIYRVLMSVSAIAPILFIYAIGMQMNFRWKVVATFCFAGTGVIALYYTKRSSSLDVAVALTLLMFTLVFFGRANIGRRLVLILLGVVSSCIVLVVAVLAFGDYTSILLDRLSLRFEDATAAGFEIDRIQEAMAYFEQGSFRERFFGRGLIGYHTLRGSLGSHIHLGWVNLVYKGGWVLFAFILFGLSRNVWNALRFRGRNEAIIGFCVPIYLAVSLGHSTFLGGYPAVLTFGLALYLFPALLHARQLQGPTVEANRRSDLPYPLRHSYKVR